MANPLTGDFDAVLLIRVTQINAILATLHQNQSNEDASPTFPHSLRLRIGDPPRVAHPDLAQLGDWLNEIPRDSGTEPDSGPGPTDRFVGLLETAPPGAARSLLDAYKDLQAARFEGVSPLMVRGTALVQLAPPSIALPPGSTSEVTIRARIRADYKPDPGTFALPAPIHGDVFAAYVARARRLQNFGAAKTILEVDLAADAAKIAFVAAPGTGLSQFDAEQLTAQVRKALRESFEPVNVELPGDFQFFQFKELGGGEALALPVRLTEPFEMPASALNTVTHNFLDADFSVAISREFVDTQLEPALETLRQFSQDIPYTTYHVAVSSVALEWKNGSIELVVRARATTWVWIAPNFDNITIRQKLTFALDAAAQHVSVVAADNGLWISGLPGFLADPLRARIRGPRDQARPQAESLINGELHKAKTRINEALQSIDDSARAEYGRFRITKDGLIVDGGIFTKVRRPAVVEFEETSDGSAFTALKSWVRGGRILRFEWSWFKRAFLHQVPWAQDVVVSTDEHRFIFPKPLQATQAADICLRLDGLQIDQNGNEFPISEGATCSVSTPEVLLRVPDWSDPPMIPIWLAGTPPDAILDEAIAGHVNVLAHSRPGSARSANSLVHFADPRMEKPLDGLDQALVRVRGKGGPPVVIVVLPPGTFGGRRREVEARLGSLDASTGPRDEGFRGQLVLTEDYTGSWNRTFDAGRTPSTYLMNDRGEFVWKHEGTLDPEALAAAMDEHLTAGRPPRSLGLSLSVHPGDRAPRALFTDDRGQQLALRKLSGHPVLVNFWQSWSSPCIRELRRLQQLAGAVEEGAPVIVAVNGGEDRKVLAEVRRQHGLTFALVHDSRRLVARQFGVHCWPTTVSIDPDGIVDHVQFGVMHERAADPHPKS